MKSTPEARLRRTVGKRGFTLICSLALAFAAAIPAWGDVAQSTGIVQTSNGPIQGYVEGGISTFKGVRYGAPPIGPLRFMAPQRPQAWSEVVQTVKFGPSAIQMASGASANPTTPLSKALATIFTTSSEMKTNEEDCLFLNVWTAGLEDGKKRPVMVWLHGGGYAYGSGSWPVYDGRNLSEKGDVVVVTVNHRLNVFGYLNLGGVAGRKYAKSGNAGMLDLVLMLEWVRDNIAAFGGDAGNVTIFGESGGGAKVSTLLAMPSAHGLFHKAIIESGPGLTGVKKETATANARAILEELKIDAAGIDAIHEAPAEMILKAAFAAAAKAGGGRGPSRLAPVVDGKVLPADPFTPTAPAISKDIPILVGWNKDEWSLFMASEPWFLRLTEEELLERAKGLAGDKAEALLAAFRKLHPDYSPTYLWNDFITNMRMFYGSVTLAERKAAQNGAPVYMYNLTWETPVGGGIFKSPHTLEMPFVFNNVEKSRPLVGPGEEPERLAAQMSDAWIAFARSGNPNAGSIPDWPAYDAKNRATMIFNLESTVVKDPLGEVRRILQGP